MTARGIADIPEGLHWAILQTHSVTIPGDARSRTHPGHGYPEHTETAISYKVFMKEADWEAEIEQMTLQGARFRAIRAEVAKVSVKVEVRRAISEVGKHL